MNSGVPITTRNERDFLWMILFGVFDTHQFIPNDQTTSLTREGGKMFGLALLSIPLYAYMAIITGVAFTFFMDYPMGQMLGIYLGHYWLNCRIFFESSIVYLGGYVADKQTRVLLIYSSISYVLGIWLQRL